MIGGGPSFSLLGTTFIKVLGGTPGTLAFNAHHSPRWPNGVYHSARGPVNYLRQKQEGPVNPWQAGKLSLR